MNLTTHLPVKVYAVSNNESYNPSPQASFYRRADVALPGFVKLMTGLFEKDQNFAQDLISYLQQRGESLHLHDIVSYSQPVELTR